MANGIQQALGTFLSGVGGGLQQQRQQQQQLQQRLRLEDLLGTRREERGIAAEERGFGRQLELLGERAKVSSKARGEESKLRMKEFLFRKQFDPEAAIIPSFEDAQKNLRGQLQEGESATVETGAGRVTFKGPKAERVRTISPSQALSLLTRNEPKFTGRNKDTTSQILNKFRTQFTIFQGQSDPVPPEKIEQIRLWTQTVEAGLISKILPFTARGTQQRIDLRAAADNLLQEIQQYNNNIILGIAQPQQQQPTATQGGQLSEEAFLKSLEQAGQLTD